MRSSARKVITGPRCDENRLCRREIVLRKMDLNCRGVYLWRLNLVLSFGGFFSSFTRGALFKLIHSMIADEGHGLSHC